MSSSDSATSRRRAAAECLLEGMVEAGLEQVSAAIQTAPPSLKQDLPSIAAAVLVCQNCVLGSLRQQAVPGEGNPHARLMFVGEGPGAEEDRCGRPFVGDSGQLLEKIIENGMGLTRQEVFIANIVKCRPPQNRTPLADEVRACTPYLEQQIEAVAPELVIALGGSAAHYLLDSTSTVASLRGKILNRPQGGPPVLVTYHPAFLLYEPQRKADCWADIQVAMRFLGLGN